MAKTNKSDDAENPVSADGKVKVVYYYGGQIGEVSEAEAQDLVDRGLATIAGPVALAIAGEDAPADSAAA
jgi:hypothetical protein